MGRRKRHMNQFGELKCPRCGEWKHITMYYISDGRICYYHDDVAYGRPQSWCKACMLTHQKGKRIQERILRDEELEATSLRERKWPIVITPSGDMYEDRPVRALTPEEEQAFDQMERILGRDQ